MSDDDEYDYEDVWEDLRNLERDGHWKGGVVPDWAAAKAKEFYTFAAGVSVLMWAYQFVARQAMGRLEEARQQGMDRNLST